MVLEYEIIRCDDHDLWFRGNMVNVGFLPFKMFILKFATLWWKVKVVASRFLCFGSAKMLVCTKYFVIPFVFVLFFLPNFGLFYILIKHRGVSIMVCNLSKM